MPTQAACNCMQAAYDGEMQPACMHPSGVPAQRDSLAVFALALFTYIKLCDSLNFELSASLPQRESN